MVKLSKNMGNTAMILVEVGGLNLLLKQFDVDLLQMASRIHPMVTTVAVWAIGISGVVLLARRAKILK